MYTSSEQSPATLRELARVVGRYARSMLGRVRLVLTGLSASAYDFAQ